MDGFNAFPTQKEKVVGKTAKHLVTLLAIAGWTLLVITLINPEWFINFLLDHFK